MRARWLVGCLWMYGVVASAQQTMSVSRLDLPGISSPLWESHPAMDPATGDLWFARSDKTFSGWRIFTSHCRDGRWSNPQPMPIAGRGLEADPWFSPDGRTVWFISTRSSGSEQSAALDIWRAQRNAKGVWQAPERLPSPVNSNAAEWFPRPAADGWLYFGSRRPGGQGKDDIWRVRREAGGAWRVENAGPGLNSADAEYEFQPSSDGRWGILATDKGMYRVVAGPDGWHRAEKFAHDINANGTEIGPMMTPDGHGFVFSRDGGGSDSGEFFLARFGAKTRWPSSCGFAGGENAASAR